MHFMDDLKEKLLFVKGLMDEPDYVNEDGIRNLINIWRSVYFDGVPERAIIGTDYATGALDALKYLIEKRKDLFENMVKEFINLWEGADPDYVKMPAKIVLERFDKLSS